MVASVDSTTHNIIQFAFIKNMINLITIQKSAINPTDWLKCNGCGYGMRSWEASVSSTFNRFVGLVFARDFTDDNIIRKPELIGAGRYYDLRSRQIHVIFGLQVAMAWIIKSFVWIYLACRQRNQRFARSSAWKVWIRLLMWLRIIAILEDNQIGEREREEKGPVTMDVEKKHGPRKVMFKNQTVAG
ncbi:hypothetical protein YC2023_098572 [Brassica napus]